MAGIEATMSMKFLAMILTSGILISIQVLLLLLLGHGEPSHHADNTKRVQIARWINETLMALL